MGECHDGSNDHAYRAGEEDGAAVNGNPFEHQSAGNSGHDLPPGEGKGSVRCGALLAAVTKGTMLTFFLGMLGLIPAIDPAGFPLRTGLWLCLAGFLGGMISGSELESGLGGRRCGLLWLAVGSPALPTWIVAVVAFLVGASISTNILVAILLTGGTAVAGAITGQYVAHRWSRAEKVPRASFWKNWAKALIYGSVTTLLLSSCFFLPLMMIAFGDSGRGWLIVPFIIGRFFLSPFLGGLVSGRMLCGVLDDVGCRPVYLAFASPALPFVFLEFVISQGFSTVLTDELFGLLTFVVASVLGSLAGYYPTLHKKRVPQAEPSSADSEGEADADDDA
jgi:hypothetical protein